MNGQRREAEGEAGWLAGLPVSIKDLVDVPGCAPPTVHRSSAIMCRRNRTRWWNGLNVRAGWSSPSRTHRSSRGWSTFNEVFGRTRNPWKHVADLRWINRRRRGFGRDGRGLAVSRLRPWRVSAAAGHYCSVVGLRPSPGRVTRGTANNLFSPCRSKADGANIPDLALFLDTMAGYCPFDPLTFDAPAVSFTHAVARARPRGELPTAPTTAAKLAVDRRRGRFVKARCVASRNWVAWWRGSPPTSRDRGGIHGAALAAFRVDRELHCRLIAINSSPTSSGIPRMDSGRRRLKSPGRRESGPPFTGVSRRCSKPTICLSLPAPRRPRST